MVLLNTRLPDMKKKNGIKLFYNLHYLITFRFAHSFLFCGHQYVFTGPILLS